MNPHLFFCKKAEEKRVNQIKHDLVYGLKKEEELTSFIESYFSDKICKTEQFGQSDWIGSSGTHYELKSRTKNYSPTSFPTSIFPCYKCKVGENNKLIIIIHYELTNDIFYIMYDRIKFSKYNKTYIKAETGYDSAVLHFEIPFSEMTKIQK